MRFQKFVEIRSIRGKGLRLNQKSDAVHHHIAFEIKGMDQHIGSLAEHGLQLIQRGEYTGGRYAYLDGQKKFGAVIELLEND